MKNTMKISGVAGIALFGIAALFKIQHWPGAGIMLTLGAMILAFAFMPSALGVLWKETHNSNKLVLFISVFLSAGLFISGILFKIQHWDGGSVILMLTNLVVVLLLIPSLLAAGLRETENKSLRIVYVLGAIGFVAFFSGFIFKIMHWQGSTALMLSGLLIIFFLVLPFYARLTWSDEKYVKPAFIFLIAGSLSIIIPSAMLNLNLQSSFDKGFDNNLKEQNALFSYMIQNKRQYMASYNDSSSFQSMAQLDSKTDDLLKVITSVEELISANSPEEPGPGQPVELGKALADYSSYLSSVIPPDSYLNAEMILDVSGYQPATSSVNSGVHVMPQLHSLAVLKNRLLAAELYSLREIAETR